MNYENDEIPEGQGDAESVDKAAIEPSEMILCYLTCPVTDYRARPLHFAFVSPIRPTRIQRILYGSTLEEHVKIDVISEKLLKDLPFLPDALFVDTKELLTIRRAVEIPTAFLSKSIESEDNPGRLTTLEYDTGSSLDDQDIVGRVLASLESYVDLVEPFARMREALKEAIKKQDA